ncbi:cytochrome P450 [Streptomyces chrestomyceticus]|uniref:cytochrome P450 n=1 Tax=Streptomyces chrestomyceticus TaxID=68185 RepID=UPI0033CBB60F
MPTTPTLHTLDTPAALHDPYPHYRLLRETAPVLWDPVGYHWTVTRHREVTQALNSPALHAAPRRLGPRTPPTLRLLNSTMLDSDPPEHTRRRRAFSKAFTPRLIADLQPVITRQVHDALNRTHHRGHMDLIGELAAPLPLHVIGELLGVPPQHRGLLHAGSRGYARLWGGDETDPSTIQQAVDDVVAAIDYCRQLVTQRRHLPSSDLTSKLLAASDDATALTNDELAVNLFVVFTAGHYTTTDFLGSSLVALMHHRDQWQVLCDDPSTTPSAVWELLRYEPPVQFILRIAADDLQLGGCHIQAGQLVVLLLAAANRDPRAFPDPDRLDLKRTHNHHLAMGHGIHACLGSALARTQSEIVLTRLATHIPHLRLDPQSTITWKRNAGLRGPLRLDMRWD